jgi:hypothetical protein
MTLSCERPTGIPDLPLGVYVNEATIVSVEDVSGTTPSFMSRPVDIGLKLTVEIGRGFQPQMLIAGNFRRDIKTGEVVAWGSAIVVQDALCRLGFTGALDPGNKVPAKALQGLVGVTFLRLSYVSGTKNTGKPRYSDWTTIGSLSDGSEDLIARWTHSRSRGYPRNYRPDVLGATTVNVIIPNKVEEDPF